MFQSENVKAYLESAIPHVDKDKHLLTCRFYINPIAYELAKEISPKIADRLFRKFSNDWQPVLEMPSAQFKIGKIPLQQMIFRTHPELPNGSLIEGVEISGLKAKKLFADKDDFAFLFDATFEVEKSVGNILCFELLHKEVFLTMKPSQRVLFDTEKGDIEVSAEMNCTSCNAKAAYLSDTGDAWCNEHVAAAVGQTVRKIKFVEKEAPAEPPAPSSEAAEEGSFITKRNRSSKKKADSQEGAE